MRAKSVFIYCVLPIALAGCGGKSATVNGPDVVTPSPSISPAPSKLFPLVSGKTTKMTGVGRQFDYTYSGSIENYSLTAGDISQGQVESEITTDSTGTWKSGSIKTSNTLLSMSNFRRSENDKLIGQDHHDEDDRYQLLAFFDPDREDAGFSYQTFGLWETSGNGRGRTGAFSVGNETAGASLPKNGTATFTGRSEAQWTDGTDNPELISAKAKLEANFANRSAKFSTETDFEGRSYLNMHGDMTYAAGSNSMSGTVSTAGNDQHEKMSGTIDGRFYGADASEVGGTYALKSTNETMMGAYGAKR